MEEIVASVEAITPEKAKEMLNTNHDNQRKISKSRVNRYAISMLNGEWQLNGEPIIISESGKLIDGQHRLNAVVEAKIPVKMLIVGGIKDKTENGDDMFIYINQENHSNVDALTIEGYRENMTGVKTSHLVKLLKYIDAFNQKKLHVRSSGMPMTNSEIVQYANSFDKNELIRVVKRANALNEQCSTVGVDLWLIAAWLEYRTQGMHEFIERLAECDSGIDGDPASTLLTWLEGMTGKSGGSIRKMKILAFFQAFNSFKQNQSRSRISIGKTTKLVYPDDYEFYEE